jgi:hypothetical protein
MEVYIRIAQWVGWPAVVAGIIIFGSIAFWMLKNRLEHQKEINAELQRKISEIKTSNDKNTGISSKATSVRLIKGSGSEVYLLSNGKRHWVPDGPTLVRLRKQFGDTHKLLDAEIDTYPGGKPLSSQCPRIAKNNRGDYFLLADGIQRLIVGKKTLEMLGEGFQPTFNITDTELLKYGQGKILTEQTGIDAINAHPWLARGTFDEVYLVRGVFKRWITDTESLHKLQKEFNIPGVKVIDDSYLNDLIEGLPIGKPFALMLE